MNAVLDEITAFLGDVPAEEYEQRRRIRDCRAVASHRVTRTGAPNARQLLWMCCEAATHYYLAAYDLKTLTQAAEMCRQMIELAGLVETMEASDGLA